MKNLKIIYLAFVCSLILFGIVFVLSANPSGNLPKDWSGFLLGASVFLLPVAWYVPLFFAKKKMISKNLELKDKFNSYSQSKILSVIFLDFGYTIHGVFYFIFADSIHWIGMGIFFLGILILFPRDKEFISLYDSREIYP
jgi:predicted neutral ceramidase superfamily lipid hydrolase